MSSRAYAGWAKHPHMLSRLVRRPTSPRTSMSDALRDSLSRLLVAAGWHHDVVIGDCVGGDLSAREGALS